MKLVADSPMAVGWLPWSFEPGSSRLVVAVKATLDLPREGVATLASEQVFVTGDEHWDDDVDRTVRYATDLELLKPQGEVWLTGTLRTREPVRELSCRARVGGVDLSFAVVGDRHWRADGGMTAPEPFTTMELCWERCFGGHRFHANPVGRGIGPDPNDPEGRVALPNIEHPTRVIRSPAERPEPAGAWPIPRAWPERARFLGTYGADYARTRWPYFAADMSWRYGQAAREAQRVAGYWRGDEEIELHHLHPEHRVVRCRLPGLRPRVFLHERERPHGPLREVGLVLDTIAMDAGEGKAFAIWRGSTPCASESLDELTHLYLTQEPLGQARTEQEYLGAFFARVRSMWEEEQAFEAEAPEPPAPQAAPEPPRVGAEPETPPTPAEILEARRRDALAQGWPEELVAELFPTEAPSAAEPDPKAIRAKLEAARAAAEQLGMGDAATLLRGVLAHMDAPPASDDAEPASRAEPPPGLWTAQERRDQVQQRIDAGEPLRGLDLADADLSLMNLAGRDLSGCILVRADLRGATLDGAILDGAILDEAKLEGATLRGASLREASFAFVEADGVDFTAAVLEDARAQRASLAGAIFRQVQARGLELEECLAVGADFERAQLEEAELGASNFDEANFRDAVLTDARLAGASLRCACLDRIDAAKLRATDGADLSEAKVRWAMLAGATFAGGILIGTKLAESNLTRASFAAARLDGAELLAVRARAASFAGAYMAGASLAGADLYGARFEAAQLTYANLANTNLYEAELWRADLTHAVLDGANVEGTKLA